MHQHRSTIHPAAEYRAAPRYKLPAMYTLVRVRPSGTQRYRWTGFVYDISTTGMRFELDNALSPEMKVDIRVMLPGREQVTFDATGSIVRLHDDDEYMPGPRRMGMVFDHFTYQGDKHRLENYLNQVSLAA